MIWVFLYTLEWPVLTLKTQLPPTLSPFSKTTTLSPKRMQFLAAAMPLGPAPTTQMRLFGTMTASPTIALFFRAQIIANPYKSPPTYLILRRIDLPDKYTNNQRACCR